MRVIKFLLELLRRIKPPRPHKKRRLNSPEDLEALVMSGTVTIRFNNATEFNDGTPAEIARTVIETRVGALPFTPAAVITQAADLVPGAAVERLFPNHPGGTWEYRVTHEDPDGKPGASALTTVVVPRGTLNAPTNLSATHTP